MATVGNVTYPDVPQLVTVFQGIAGPPVREPSTVALNQPQVGVTAANVLDAVAVAQQDSKAVAIIARQSTLVTPSQGSAGPVPTPTVQGVTGALPFAVGGTNNILASSGPSKVKTSPVGIAVQTGQTGPFISAQE